MHRVLIGLRGFVERSFDLSTFTDLGFIVEIRVSHLAWGNSREEQLLFATAHL